MNLSFRLYLLLAAIVLSAFGGATWSLVRDARQAVLEEMQSTMDLTTTLVNGLVLLRESADSRSDLAALIESIQARHLDIAVTTGRPSGNPVLLRRTAAPSWFVELIRPDLASLSRTVDFPGSSLQVRLTADPADEIEESWRETRRSVTTLIIFVSIMLALFARWGSLALRPLARISKAMDQIAAGAHGTRLTDTYGIPDIDNIVVGFNRMAEAQERDAAKEADYAKRGMAIREEERRYLARELHDEMGQSISAIKALAVSISQRGGGVDPRIKRSADTIAEVSTHVYDHVRQMMSQLHPTTLDELGLVSALEDMVDKWNSHHETVFCAFIASEPLPSLSREVSINVFRIVQEALTNVAKHAQASEATIKLTCDEEAPEGVRNLRITITDNGVGFDPKATHRGLGLVGIHERVKALSGRITLASEPKSGTQFQILIPIGKAE